MKMILSWNQSPRAELGGGSSLAFRLNDIYGNAAYLIVYHFYGRLFIYLFINFLKSSA